MRNRSTQYASMPDYDWYKLRHQWPFIYESYAQIQPGMWTHVKIEVKGREAKLYLNGSDAAGTWQLKFTGDAGGLEGSLKLTRNGNKLTGTWSGGVTESAVQGRWRDGYVEITFPTAWPRETSQVTARLAGWVDGDSAQGRMVVAR
jgi:hypothetical protein